MNAIDKNIDSQIRSFLLMLCLTACAILPARSQVDQATQDKWAKNAINKIRMSSLIFTSRIGYRPSIIAGERSSIVWLSRLIKGTGDIRQYDVDTCYYSVYWHTLMKGKRVNLETRYATRGQIVTRIMTETRKTSIKIWRGVAVRKIMKTANKRGDLNAFGQSPQRLEYSKSKQTKTN